MTAVVGLFLSNLAITTANHASLGHLLCRLGRLPEAKDPKKNLHACQACQGALLTIYKGHLITTACKELDLDSDWPKPPSGEVCIANFTQKIVTQCTIVPEAILGQHLEESEDGVYDYVVFCAILPPWYQSSPMHGVREMVSVYFDVGDFHHAPLPCREKDQVCP